MTAPMPIVAAARPRRFRPTPAVMAAVTIGAAAMLLRGGRFGNPLAGFDEQFYLLVGDRMWYGALPYVDIWDRKPIGLFALFAAIRLLPGDGVLAAQVVATLFAAATAWCVTLLARRAAGWPGATMAGILYLAELGQLWGGVAQAPVFYNLPVAAAALATLHAAARPLQRRWTAAGAMLLAGVAIQIKTNAVFEGVFFGGWLLAAGWEGTRSSTAMLRRAGLLAAVGAAPTVLAIAIYAALGELPAWWQANVGSVIAKGRPADAIATATLIESATLFAPVAILALIGLYVRTRGFARWSREEAFLVGWIVVATIDFAAIGGYWPHYALPLLLACCPLAASAFARRPWGPVLFAVVLIGPVIASGWTAPRATMAQRAIARQVVAALPADVRSECLFIYEGPPIYYHLTRACLVSRFAYSAHLSTVREAAALGVDAAAALRAALARRPGTVMTVVHANWVGRDPRQEAIVLAELRRHYRPVALLPYAPAPAPARIVLWRRSDLAAR